jgi:Arc/MetJ-type ribon-helix-helix transcriptional regulator
MKIVTVNIQESYLEAISKLVGKDGLYPSRSELIRVACRDFLLKELTLARVTAKLISNPLPQPEPLDPSKFVQIPIDSLDENNEPIRDFKTYKIVRRLEIN